MAKFKRISADEARAKRKDHIRDVSGKGDAVIKAAKGPVSYNKEERSGRFTMTSQSVDRYGDIVVTAGLDTSEFELNPVALLFHMNRSWPIGKWDNMEKILKGRPPRLEGDMILMPPTDGLIKEIDQAAFMLENDGIRACSIGFVPNWDDIEMILDDEGKWTGGLKFNKSELVECSLCPVPANPDALMKAVEGNMTLAKELIEDVLDNWAKSPAGVLLPRAEFEKAHKEAGGGRVYVIGNKELLGRRAVPLTADKLAASTDDEARQFIGCKVKFRSGHPENEASSHCKAIGDAEGEVLDSYIVDHGEKKGVHALCVEFLTEKWSGAFRGIAAERLELVSKPEPKQQDLPVTDEEIAAAAERNMVFEVARLVPAVKGARIAVDADTGAILVEKDGKFVVDKSEGAADVPVNVVVTAKAVGDKTVYEVTKQYSPALVKNAAGEWEAKTSGEGAPETEKQATQVENLDVMVDVTELETEVRSFFDGLIEKISSAFKRSAPEERIEPVLEPPVPSAAEIEAMKARAAETRARITEKGLI